MEREGGSRVQVTWSDASRIADLIRDFHPALAASLEEGGLVVIELIPGDPEPWID